MKVLLLLVGLQVVAPPKQYDDTAEALDLIANLLFQFSNNSYCNPINGLTVDENKQIMSLIEQHNREKKKSNDYIKDYKRGMNHFFFVADKNKIKQSPGMYYELAVDLHDVINKKAKAFFTQSQAFDEKVDSAWKWYVKILEKELSADIALYNKFNKIYMDILRPKVRSGKIEYDGLDIYFYRSSPDHIILGFDVKNRVETTSFPLIYALSNDKQQYYAFIFPYTEQSGWYIRTFYSENIGLKYGITTFNGLDSDEPFTMSAKLEFYNTNQMNLQEQTFFNTVMGDKKTVFVPFPPKHERNQLLLEYLKEYVVDILAEEIVNSHKKAEEGRIIEEVEDEEEKQNLNDDDQQEVVQKVQEVPQSHSAALELLPENLDLSRDEESLQNIKANAAHAREEISSMFGKDMNNEEIVMMFNQLDRKIKEEQEKYTQAVAQGEDLHAVASKVESKQKTDTRKDAKPKNKAMASATSKSETPTQQIVMERILHPKTDAELKPLLSLLTGNLNIKKSDDQKGSHQHWRVDGAKCVTLARKAVHSAPVVRMFLEDVAKAFGKELIWKPVNKNNKKNK